MKSNVTTDNEQFSKRFCVRADIPQEAYYILTPHMMESILTMADKSGGTVYMSFLRDEKMHVAVKTECDFLNLGKVMLMWENCAGNFFVSCAGSLI